MLSARDDPLDQGERLAAAARHLVPEGESRSLIEGAIAIAREHLEMEIGWLAEFTGDTKIFRVLAGDKEEWGLKEGDTMTGAETYCRRMLDGRIPEAVPDTSQNRELLELEVTQRLRIVSYIGVPLVLGDGSVYGTFCCASHQVNPTLGEQEVQFMRVLSRLIARELDHLATERELRHAAVRAAATEALLAALAIRDKYSGDHTTAVVDLAGRVARRRGFSDDEVEDACLVALLHDVGKVGIPDHVLRKPGALDDDEWAIVRQHSALGAEVVAAVSGVVHLAPAVRATHERWDGTGYPDGLAGEDIPVAARISLVCDAYDAMTSDRPYRKALDLAEALEQVRANAGTQFCPLAAQALLDEIAAAAPGPHGN